MAGLVQLKASDNMIGETGAKLLIGVAADARAASCDAPCPRQLEYLVLRNNLFEVHGLHEPTGPCSTLISEHLDGVNGRVRPPAR